MRTGTTTSRRRSERALGAYASLAIPLLFALASVARPAAHSAPIAPLHLSDAAALGAASTTAAGESAGRAAFRLGDAARPFAWATAVADFDTDGRPDVAVADHVARRTSAYAYRLEFSIAGQSPHAFTFESRHGAVTVRVADVDHDNDLDVVVATPLSGETVGVWLNDGHGHFTAGDVGQVRAALGPLPSVDSPGALSQGAALEAPPRIGDALPAAFHEEARAPDTRITHVDPCFVRSLLQSATTAPRAPPISIPASVS